MYMENSMTERKIEFIFPDELQIVKRTGMCPVDVPRCCKIEEDGIIVVSTKGRSQLENKAICEEIIKLYKISKTMTGANNPCDSI